MKEDDWREYRRFHLPHLRMRGAIYFVTWRLFPGQSDLAADERALTAESMQRFHSQRYLLHAWVVMNDHVHALVEPGPDFRLEEILRGWKSYTSHQMTRRFGRVAPLWMTESYDRIVRDQAEFDEKLNYIMNNPLKRWPDLPSYPWVGSAVDESRSGPTETTD